jgi:hypothetical protein
MEMHCIMAEACDGGDFFTSFQVRSREREKKREAERERERWG